MFEGFSSFSIGLIPTMIQTICVSFDVDFITNEKKLTKVLKGPFSCNIQWIFFIFDRFYPYNNTNNLCKFKKNQIKNVDFIA